MIQHPSSFNGLRVRIDPWEVEYGSELPIGGPIEEESADVALDTELAPDEWRPLLAGAHPVPPKLLFVDGIRRLEGRLVVDREGRVSHGALGTFGVGAVCVTDGRASWHTEHVARLAVLGSNERFTAPIYLGDALEYAPLSTPNADPDGPILAVHAEMRAAEERLARELSDDTDALVVSDGPLTFGDVARGHTVGFVKRLFKLYVSPIQMQVVARMGVGQRSPIFSIGGSARFARLSWFIRLAQPLPVDADLTGLARLEVSGVVGLDVARRLADVTTAVLPTFVPSRARDPRAPQNLLPIGALEAHLRCRMGDARLVRRRLAALIAKESVRV